MPLARFSACTSRWCLALAAVSRVASAATPATEWHFAALLDDRPIGTHTFALTTIDDGTRALVSEARFDVKVLGFTAYRYRHHAEERWRGDCLTAIAANTDDDGKVTTVSIAAFAPGCVMSFAYWNAALRTQHQLLDPGTGRIEPVTITELPTNSIDVRGQHIAVSGLHITGLLHPIDVWYAHDQWVGLDTAVEGGRRLSYRLK